METYKIFDKVKSDQMFQKSLSKMCALSSEIMCYKYSDIQRLKTDYEIAKINVIMLFEYFKNHNISFDVNILLQFAKIHSQEHDNILNLINCYWDKKNATFNDTVYFLESNYFDIVLKNDFPLYNDTVTILNFVQSLTYFETLMRKIPVEILIRQPLENNIVEFSSILKHYINYQIELERNKKLQERLNAFPC